MSKADREKLKELEIKAIKESKGQFAYDKIAGRVKFILGSGSNCTKKAIEKSQLAQKIGADGLLVVTPYYNKCTQKGLVKYYNDKRASVAASEDNSSSACAVWAKSNGNVVINGGTYNGDRSCNSFTRSFCCSYSFGCYAVR